MPTETTPEQHFNDFWKDLVTDEHGYLDQEAVENELYDYSSLMDRHSSFISYTTNYRLSKTSYTLQSLTEVFEEEQEKNIKNRVIQAVLDLADAEEITIGHSVSTLLAHLGITANDLENGYVRED